MRRGVTELHAVELDFLRQPGQWPGVRQIHDAGFFIEQFLNPLHAAAGVNEGRVKLREAVQRVTEVHEERLERHQRTDGQLTVERQVSARRQHHHLQDEGANAGRPFDERAEKTELQIGRGQLRDPLGEPRQHGRLQAERLDDGLGNDVFLNAAGDLRFVLFALVAGRHRARRDQAWPDQTDRKNEQRKQAKPPFNQKHQDRAQDDVQCREDALDDGEIKGALERRKIGGETRADVGSLHAGEIIHPELLEMGEHARAEIVEHAG